MKAEHLFELIKSIGLTYRALTSKNLVPDVTPSKNQESAFFFYVPEAGIDLFFFVENEMLERVLITKKEYSGELPYPLASLKNRGDVLAEFGDPSESKGHQKMPGHLGEIGGTDMYYLPKINLNAKATFTYDTSLEIRAITFHAIY